MLWFKGMTCTNVSGPELYSVLESVWDVWRGEAEEPGLLSSCGQHPFILQAAFHLWTVEMKHSFLLRTKAKAFTLMQVPGLGVLQPLIASLGFDPRLRRRSAQHSSGRCGGEVLSSPWSRLTPVSAP